MLTGISFVGLAAIVSSSYVTAPAPWIALVLNVIGLVACVYAGLEAWQKAEQDPALQAARQARREEAKEAGVVAHDGAAPAQGFASKSRSVKGAFRSLLPFGFAGGTNAAPSPGSPNEGASVITGFNPMLLRVALGSCMFAAIGILFLLGILFQLA